MQGFTLLWLTGCSSGSRWLQTSALCDFPAAAIDAASFTVPPTYPSTACVDAVLDDFGVNHDELLAADDLPDPYGLVYGDAIGDGALGRLLWAAHALLATDLGEVDTLTGRWIPSLGLLARSGPINAHLYDYVTARIDATTIGRRRDASAGLQGGTLLLYDLPPGIDGAALLVHEARHGDGIAHVSCGGAQDELVCDDTDRGAWGFELAVHELARDHSADPVAQQIEQSWLDALPQRILD